jgi:hypothetical protein
MSLGIYNAIDNNAQLNKSNNLFRVTFDGRIGGAQVYQIYIRNNDPTRWYSDIELSAEDTEAPNLVDNSTEGYGWKFLSKDIAPTELEWRDIDWGNTLYLADSIGSSSIGDISTFLSVWVRVEVPRGISVQKITDIVFRLAALEHFVHG